MWMDQSAFAGVQAAFHTVVGSLFSEFIYQLESKPWDLDSKRTDGAHDHYQGYGHVGGKGKKRPESLGKEFHAALAKLGDEDKGQSIGKVYSEPSSTAGQQALKAYAMKPDTRFLGPWFDKKETDRIAFDAAERLPQLRPWQKELEDVLASAVGDDRKIFFVVDPSGNTGKTRFARHLRVAQKAVILTPGDERDVLYLVSEKASAPLYVMNVTKNLPSTYKEADLLAVLEKIKDGVFTSTKYKTKDVVMPSPNVLCFTNHVIAHTKLSLDRTVGAYFSLGLGPDGLVHLIPRAVEWVEAQKARNRKKAAIMEALRKREKEANARKLKKLKSGKGLGSDDDDEFAELYAELMGRPPPRTVKQVEAALPVVSAKERDGAEVKMIYVPGPVGSSRSSAPAQVVAPPSGKDDMPRHAPSAAAIAFHAVHGGPVYALGKDEAFVVPPLRVASMPSQARPVIPVKPVVILDLTCDESITDVVLPTPDPGLYRSQPTPIITPIGSLDSDKENATPYHRSKAYADMEALQDSFLTSDT